MNECGLFYTLEGGSYYFHSFEDFSAYQGWCVFFENPWNLFKVVDRISGDFDISFSGKTLFLKRSSFDDFFIDLDFRLIHDFDSKGRIYEVYEKNNLLIVKYTKFFDDSLSEIVFTKFLAIKGLSSFDLIKEWVEKSYPYDAERGSLDKLFVFRLLRSNSDNLSLGFGLSEEEAVVNSLALPIVKEEVSSFTKAQIKKISGVDKDALLSADKSFSSCVKKSHSGDFMIFAGYPWFFQVWGRDECISLVGLFSQKKFDVAKKIILRNLKRMVGGVLPNRYPESVLGSADATGWLFQRILLFLKLSRGKDFALSSRELGLVEEKLDLFISHCKDKSSNGLVMNGPKETWMDTNVGSSDVRDGARVEVQALFLSALELKKYLRQLASDDAQVLRFDDFIDKTKSLIRHQLIKGGVLHDGIVDDVLDTSIRPNVFLAYYIYPDLVTKSQWSKTFNHVLDDSWLDWGGISSIGKSHELFTDTYSGMNNRSYHRGDSWFFINNIVALSLYSLDKKLYSDKIKKIKDASVQEMLHSGFKGFCAEVSSAKQLESKGCLNQAWSSATLLELLLKIKA
jgi:glycogen debranching enzyme